MKRILFVLFVSVLCASSKAQWVGNGTELDPYLIQSHEDLVTLATHVNNGTTYEGIYFKVNVETLDMSSVASFARIGNSSRSFQGTFDGNNVVIQHLTISDNNSYTGLFGYIGSNGVVKNLTLDETCSITGHEQTGGICGHNSGVIDHCTNNADVSGTYYYVGGIAGYNAKMVSNCINNGRVSSTVHSIGGIVGYNTGGTVKDCVNNSSDLSPGSGWDKLGGIVGSNYRGGVVRGCENKGNIVLSVGYSGGVVGENFSHIIDCVNSGDFTASSYDVGGIAGWGCDTCTVIGCINTGNIKAGNAVGGIIGGNGAKLISNCKNSGTITASIKVGGIIGSASNCPISDCENTGQIIATYSSNGEAGGIAGIFGSSSITNCNNSGKITAVGGNIGGIVGLTEYKVTISGCNNDADVESESNNVGGIVGISRTSYDSDLIFENCINSGQVKGKETVGGITGSIEASSSNATVTFRKCNNEGHISGYNHVGGIAGNFGVSQSMRESTITDCHNKGNIDVEHENGGGILGRFSTGYNVGIDFTISDCSHTGNVTGGSYVGGLVGYYTLYSGSHIKLQNSQSNGDINGVNCIGGLLGMVNYYNTSSPKIEVSGCESKSNAFGDSWTGALIGRILYSDHHILSENYYDDTAIVKVGETVYRDETPRGVGATSGQAPYDITENNGAVMRVTAANITFVDDKVKALCVANWDTNGDGELSEEEAAAVTTLGEVFTANEEITSFDEFRYFTGVTAIDEGTFVNCSALRSLTLPASLEYLTVTLFAGCKSLEAITVAEGNTEFCVVDGILYDNAQEYVIACPAKKTGSVTLPETVTYICPDAFLNCTLLEKVVVPEGLEEIGIGAFAQCHSLTEINLGAKITEIPDDCFAFCYNLKEIVIPETVTAIGLRAFAGCSKLEEVTLSSHLKTIDGGAFGSCVKLQAITLSVTLETIGENAFAYTSLQEITLPASLQSIGDYAFDGVPLKTVYAEMPTPVSITDGVFNTQYENNFKEATLYVPAGKKTLYAAAEVWKDFKEIIQPTIPGDVTGSGTVDVQDATLAVNYILGEESSDYDYAAADMNGDGVVDVFDITALINIILEGGGSAAPRRAPATGGEDVLLTAVSDGVMMDINSPERFTSFQLDVTVPHGTELSGTQLTGSSQTHTVWFAKTGEDRYRIVALSMDSRPLAANDGHLLQIQLTGTSSGTVSVDGVLFVTPQGKAQWFKGATAATTHIEQTVTDVDDDDAVYDLSGRRLSLSRRQLGKGIYVINGRKVVIK